MDNPIPDNSIWVYKNVKYRVNSVLVNNLTQYQEQWYPTVRYTMEPPTKLVFYRSNVEFLSKFDPL